MPLPSFSGMTRRFFAASLLALAGAFAACGGGDDGDATASPSGSSSVTNGGVATATATPTPESVLATPTPLNDGDPLLSIVAGGTSLAPTASDFGGYPQTSLTANGTSYTGVTLADLAEVTGATGAFFEIEGVRSDGVRYAIARHATAELGDSSLLVVTSTGQVDFVSTGLDPSQWMTAVSAVTFP